MAITINWATKVINVPQADLTPLGGGVYELDVDWFRLQLKSLEDSEEGMIFPDTHRHNTTVVIGNLTLARSVEIINGYTVTFEDGQYAVVLTGANNNVAEVTNVNQVSVRSTNSAGLVVADNATGLADEVWAKMLETGFSADRLMRIIAASVAGKVSGGPTTPTFRNVSDTADQLSGTADTDGNRSSVTYGS